MAKIDKTGRMIAIADYLFANPNKERADVLATFGSEWQMATRTIDRIIKEAKEYNSKRLKEIENIKSEVLSTNTKTIAESELLSRLKAMEVLSKIALNEKEKSNERIKAIVQLSKIEGWEAPVKTENENNTQLTANITIQAITGTPPIANDESEVAENIKIKQDEVVIPIEDDKLLAKN